MLRLVILALSSLALNGQIENDAGNLAEVRALLDEIRAETDKKFGLFFDPDTVSKSYSQVSFDDGTEATVNRPFHRELFENDIILTVPQAEAILQDIKETNKTQRRPRQAQPGLDSFWKTTTIPYKFYYNDADWQNLIRSALRHIESETCIRFDENGPGKDYLLYIRGSGCWSNVGRVGGRQQVSIGWGCDALGIVAHETLHALALWHEQSRTDRDNYISIDFTKIFQGTQSNFEKRTARNSDNMGQPYDMGSVMHYGSRAFSTNYDAYSILTKDPNYQQTIGQRAGISFKDAKMINLRYCQNVCPTQLKCQNHGYTDPNYCYRCKCPAGYGGNLCQSVPLSNVPKCEGGELKAFSTSRALRSPEVIAGAKCFWRIKANKNERIQINFDKSSFLCETACSSYVELKYKKNKIPTGARICCDAPQRPIYSENNEVLVMFVGANDIQKGYTGFQLSYKSIPGEDRRKGSRKTRPRVKSKSKSNPKRPNHHVEDYEEYSNYSGENTSTEETETPWTVPTTEAATTKATTTTTPTTTTTTASTTTTTTTTTTVDPSLYTGEWSKWAQWSGCSISCGGCGQKKRLRACYGGNEACIGQNYEYAECGELPCFTVKPSTMSGNSVNTHRCDGRLLLPCDLMQKLDFGTTRPQSQVSKDENIRIVHPPSVEPTSNQFLDQPNPQNSPFLDQPKPFLDAPKPDQTFLDQPKPDLAFLDQPKPTQSAYRVKREKELPYLKMNEYNRRMLQEVHQEHERRKRFVDGNKQLIEMDSVRYCEKKFSYNCPTNLLTISIDWSGSKNTLLQDPRKPCCRGYDVKEGTCQRV